MERVYVELRRSHALNAASALNQFVQGRELAAK